MAEQIVVEYKVELGNLKAKLGEIEKELNKSAENVKKVSTETKNSMTSLGKLGENIGQQLKDVGKGLLAAFAVTEIISFGKESIKAFQEAELNAKLLRSAVMDIGNEGEASFQKLIDQSARLQDISIFSDDDIQKAQTQLIQYGLLSDQVEALTPKILDLAAAKGIPLANATDLVVQGLNGMERGLKANGIRVDLTGNSVDNYNKILVALEKVEGQSQAVLETSAGKWANLKNKVDDAGESIGNVLVRSIENVGTVFEFIFGRKMTEAEKKFTDSTKNAEKALDALNKTANNSVPATKETIKNIAYYTFEIDKLDKALKSEGITIADTNIKLAEKAKLEKELADLTGKAAKDAEIEKKRLEDLQKINDARIKAFQDLKNKEIELTKAANIQLAQSEIDKVNIASEATAAELSLLYQKTDMGLAATEEYNLAILANDKATDEKIREIQKKKWDEEQANREKDLKAADDGFAEFKALFIKNNADLKNINKKAAEDKKTLRDQELQASNDILTALGDANNAALNVELANLQEQLDKKQITQEQFDAKTRAAKRASAENDKALQIFSITINTAAAIVKMLADPGGFAGVGLSIAAGIAGLAQLALVASQPLPAFATGTDFVGLGKNRKGRDTIPALLNEGEAIIPTDQNAQYPGLSKAWINGSLDRYILSNFVAPAINEHKRKIDAKNSESFASEIAKAILINQRGFNDKNLVDSDVKTRDILRLQSKYLKNMASSLSDSNTKIIRKRGWNV